VAGIGFLNFLIRNYDESKNDKKWTEMKKQNQQPQDLNEFKNHPVSNQIDDAFKQAIKAQPQAVNNNAPIEASPSEISPDGLDIDLPPETIPFEEGFELALSDDELQLDEEELVISNEDNQGYGDLSFSGDDLGEIEADLSSGAELSSPENFNLEEELSLSEPSLVTIDSSVAQIDQEIDPGDLNFLDEKQEDELILDSENELSDDAKKKLEEIDQIMVKDASSLYPDLLSQSSTEEPLVNESVKLDGIDLSEAPEESPPINKKKRKKEMTPVVNSQAESGDFSDISQAYSGEMERLKATISNLRADRDELLKTLQSNEESQILHNRQLLSLRAELDEKKIELTITRKKLNEEILDLKDKLKVGDERKLILEEKIRVMVQDIDLHGHKNRVDLKRIQMREKELEQKLELLKADTETQIRNRDLKILELKRKLDSMEFDMESISQQEKKSVESRFELEDKLEKAIKTLRTAITVLEEDENLDKDLKIIKKSLDV
jgi:hypothetical protein